MTKNSLDKKVWDQIMEVQKSFLQIKKKYVARALLDKLKILKEEYQDRWVSLSNARMKMAACNEYLSNGISYKETRRILLATNEMDDINDYSE
jgi:hypothetical protein